MRGAPPRRPGPAAIRGRTPGLPGLVVAEGRPLAGAPLVAEDPAEVLRDVEEARGFAAGRLAAAGREGAEARAAPDVRDVGAARGFALRRGSPRPGPVTIDVPSNRSGREAREGPGTRVDGSVIQFFFDAQQLVVLGDTL